MDHRDRQAWAIARSKPTMLKAMPPSSRDYRRLRAAGKLPDPNRPTPEQIRDRARRRRAHKREERRVSKRFGLPWSHARDYIQGQRLARRVSR